MHDRLILPVKLFFGKFRSKPIGPRAFRTPLLIKVLGYYPERGYVKIDTDGLDIVDKISLLQRPLWLTPRLQEL